MQASKHNITGRIHGSASSYIINALTRNADILDPETARQLAAGTIPDPAEFIARGYLIEPGGRGAAVPRGVPGLPGSP